MLIGKFLRKIEYVVSVESTIYQFWNSFLAPKEVRTFTREYLKFSPTVRQAINRKHPRFDRYLLVRNPKIELAHENNGIVNFETRELYKPQLEQRINMQPYDALFKALEKIIQEVKPSSITEIGCSTGPLLEIINSHHPEIQISGIEGFDFYKELSADSIRDRIFIADLRRPLIGIKPSEMTICLEVAEHIDPEMLDVFLENIYFSTTKWLLMSWSSTYPRSDAPPQHISPVTLRQYRKIMRSIGFVESKFLTNLFRQESGKYEHFQSWWRKSGIVWEKTS